MLTQHSVDGGAAYKIAFRQLSQAVTLLAVTMDGGTIEDQGFPKKCGHLDDKEIVSREDWLAKIRAAASARRTPDFTIIARTEGSNTASTDLHLACGFELVGVEREVGRKHGRWLDVIELQLLL